MALVITTCTNSKRQPVPTPLQMGALPRTDIATLGTMWAERLKVADRVDLRALYAGRAFSQAASAADLLGARLLVVSAGLGLVDGASQVPPYACTVLAGAADSVAGRATDRASPAIWWSLLQDHSPFSIGLADVVSETDGPILAALSDSYLEMLAPEMTELEARARERLRLFTRTPLSRVPEQLRAQVMPYDDRLDGRTSSHRGPRSYFAARALKHFAEHILNAGDARSATEHALAVIAALDTWTWPPIVERQRLSDAEIMRLMDAHWERAGGATGRLLRLLRDELHVACEQGRCKLLAARVREART